MIDPETQANRERVLRGLVAAGWDAAIIDVGVVVRFNGRVWRVVGGDFERPSMLGCAGLDPARIAWTRPARPRHV